MSNKNKQYTKFKTQKKQSANINKNAVMNKSYKPKSTQEKANLPQKMQNKVSPLKIIPLGGLGEIGKNITLFEYEGDMILIDCGMSFPDETMPGVDIVIPDFSYIIENKSKIKGLFVTHGHEDHIGAIPYLLKEFNLPIYATPLTIGLISGKLREHKLLADALLNVALPGNIIEVGKFSVEFIHVNHSIPDASAFAIRCGAGIVVHTGDFKIDTTPIDDKVIDLARFGALGQEGVLALMSDSTNAERPGYTPSERTVGESFQSLFKQAKHQRIIVATFSSNIHRIQQIIDEAVNVGRKVAASGRSMLNVIDVAKTLGYLNIPDNVLVDIENIRDIPDEKLVIITTGSQGEPLSALHRMAFSEHKQVEIRPNDYIIISANPIPGNEKLVDNVINAIIAKGAKIIYEKMYDVHVSGHACQDEIKLIMALTKPKYFIPVHGEQKHLRKNASVGGIMGIPTENIIIAQNGNVIELTQDKIKINGNINSGMVFVDGLGVGDVGNIVLRDRKALSEDGFIFVSIAVDSYTAEIISGPEIISRGFVFVKESEHLMEEIRQTAADMFYKCYENEITDQASIKSKISSSVTKFLYNKTHRKPMVITSIMEV